MTIEQLLGMSADQLEAISLADKEKYFAPYLDITRPERAAKLNPTVRSSKPSVAQRNPDGYNKAKQFLLANSGINLDEL